jgi:hypothetical protein
MNRDGQAGTAAESEKHRPDVGSTELVGSEPPVLEEQLAGLRHLLEQDAVEEARSLAQDLFRRWPESERVHHWAEVLAPPKVSVSQAGQARSLDRERTWLSEHAGDYPGCWLAVFEDRLVAADPDLRVVLAATRKTLGRNSALLHFEPYPAGACSIFCRLPRCGDLEREQPGPRGYHRDSPTGR